MHAVANTGVVVGILMVVFLAAAILTIWRPSAILIRFLQRRWTNIFWEVNTKQRIVALTVDDGPSEYTEEIREILDAHGATATFFVIGSHIPGKEQTLQRHVASGDDLGNHALYDEPSWKLSDEELSAQIKLVDRQIQPIYESCALPLDHRYFRPGSGFFTRRIPGKHIPPRPTNLVCMVEYMAHVVIDQTRCHPHMP